MTTKIVTIAAMKGGVGKTMMTVQIAAILAEKGKVLLVDCDPQSNATTGLNVVLDEIEEKGNVADIFEKRKARLDDVVLRAPLAELPNIDLVPSTIWLTATEMAMIAKPSRETALARFFAENEEGLKRYSHVIIDTNPSMGVVNQNAFYASDSIIVVTDISYNGLQGARMFSKLWGDIREDLGGGGGVDALLINRDDARIALSSSVREVLEEDEEFGPILLKTRVPDRVKFRSTEVNAVPINVLYPKSKENQVMHSLVKELKGRKVL